MATEIIVALIEIAPLILAVVAILVLVIIFRDSIRQRILPRLAGLNILGVVEITLLKESLDEVASEHHVRLSEEDKWSALQRAQHVLPVLQGAHLLWVNDHPEGNRELVNILRSLGTVIDQARHSDEALTLLHRHHYHAVISDIKRTEGERTEGEKAGLQMISRMLEERVYRWTIFYVLKVEEVEGVPKNAFGITNRPDRLLHLIMDVLERERWGQLSPTVAGLTRY